MVKINSSKMTALDLIKKITIEIDQYHPTKEKMMQDIKLMNFKIKPVSGDIFTLMRKEIGFIESLWKLGKIEEIVSQRIDSLEDDERELFLNYLEDLQQRTQKNIANQIEHLSKKEQDKIKLLEFEVFKDRWMDQTKLN